jgi:hypothetical protein
MPHLKDSYTPPGSDESLYRLMNSSLLMCQVFNSEAIMLTEAEATITQPLPVKKTNLGKIICLEIVASLILIGLALSVQLTNNSNVVKGTVELHNTSQHQEKQQ